MVCAEFRLRDEAPRVRSLKVAGGGYATAGDISSDLTRGKVYNYAAYTLLVPGIVGLAVGVPLVVRHRDRGQFKVTPVATAEVKALVLEVPLP